MTLRIFNSLTRRTEVFTPIEPRHVRLYVCGVTVYDLAAGGVDYSTSGGFVDDIATQLDDYKQQIIDGEIEVPTAP